MATSEGAISTATTSSDTTTSTGVTPAITISGATTVLSCPTPAPCSQAQNELSRSDDSSICRTPSTAGSQ